MPDSEQTLVTYLDLAVASQQRRRLSESDKLTVLAAVTGLHLGWPEVAEACRAQVLAHNPRHLVRRWPTIEAALATERFQLYLKHVQRQYPPERAEYMLGCLGQRPVFTGSSAHEMASQLLAKLSSERPTATDVAAPPGPVASHRAAGADGTARTGPSSRRRAPSVAGKRHVARLPGRVVARRLRSRKANQEYLWWPYWTGLALLAVVVLVWAVRRHG
ncbi:MAG TPA: hypothetical protein VHY91_20890 [Pirellulales bacterium]|jgi:hypothetical protein|nr:hypothetical protein [Pirellulales bacterium]